MPKWQALKTQALKNERRNDAKCMKGTPMMRKVHEYVADHIIGEPPKDFAEARRGTPMMRKPYEHVAKGIIGGPSLYFATPRRGTPMMRK